MPHFLSRLAAASAVTVLLLSALTQPVSAQPVSAAPKETVTVLGTNLAGKPDTGDVVLLVNADNSAIFGQNLNVSVGRFSHGVYRYHVPAGPYWALGEFGNALTGTEEYTKRLVVLPQFSVTKNTTVHIAERAATSKITMVTPRPASPVGTDFSILRTGKTGPPMKLFFTNSMLGPPASASVPPMWVSPTSQRPTVGAMHVWAGQELASPPGPGTPYWYALQYQTQGTIPGQPYVVQPKDLATVSERYYNAVKRPAQIALFGALLNNYPVGHVNPEPILPATPGRLTAYLGGNVPSMTWGGYDMPMDQQGNTLSGGVSQFLPYRPGSHTTDNWDAYPLHPGVNENPYPQSEFDGMQPSASRIGNKLLLSINPSDDNQPGHSGAGFRTVDQDSITGRYVIDQNGKQIAGGPARPTQGNTDEFSTQVTLSPKPSVVSFGLNVASKGPDYRLSTATHTVWTWPSAQQSGVKLPGDWYCEATVSGVIHRCAVQPMMTLRYAVAGMALNGQVPAGREVVSLTVGHLQLVKPIAIAKVAMSVSFDGGQTWRPAQVTGRDGHYQADFDAPAGAYVMTRTSASDAAGGSVTETITRAFQVKS